VKSYGRKRADEAGARGAKNGFALAHLKGVYQQKKAQIPRLSRQPKLGLGNLQ
jgi:hypothetical protein